MLKSPFDNVAGFQAERIESTLDNQNLKHVWSWFLINGLNINTFFTTVSNIILFISIFLYSITKTKRQYLQVFERYFTMEILRKLTFFEEIASLFSKLTEAATRGVLKITVFLEISQYSHENTCARASFSIKLQASGLQLYLKETLTQVFSLWILRNF